MSLGQTLRLRPLRVPIVALALAWPGVSHASVLDWLNDQVGRVLKEQDTMQKPPEYDKALRLLDEVPRAAPLRRPASRPGNRSSARPARRSESAPASGVRLAFREVLPLDTGSAPLRQFGTRTYELGSWSLTQGFVLPARLADLLETGIQPSRDLVEAFIQTLTQRPGHTTLLRAQTAMERLMLQIQSSHQLVVEIRAVLDSAHEALSRIDREIEPIMTREGQVASMPGMVALTQIIQKGMGNQKSKLRQLDSLLVFFRKSFQAATAEVGHLERLSHQLAYLTRDQIRLGDRKADLQELLTSLFTVRDGLGTILKVVQTSKDLVKINQQSLMHLLVTMDRPGARSEGLVLRPGSQAPVPGSLARVNQILADLNRQTGPVLAQQQTSLKKIVRWTRELQDFKASPLELEPLPRWVFTQSTLPRSAAPAARFSLLPEDEKDLSSVLEVLEQDVEQDDPSLRSRQLELDASLGDPMGPDRSRGSTPPQPDITLPAWY